MDFFVVKKIDTSGDKPRVIGSKMLFSQFDRVKKYANSKGYKLDRVEKDPEDGTTYIYSSGPGNPDILSVTTEKIE